MYYELSKEQQKLREQMKACHQTLVELEARGGIADAAEKLRTQPPSYLGVYDAAERDSDEQRELVSSVERIHEDYNNRRLRNFGSRDRRNRHSTGCHLQLPPVERPLRRDRRWLSGELRRLCELIRLGRREPP